MCNGIRSIPPHEVLRVDDCTDLSGKMEVPQNGGEDWVRPEGQGKKRAAPLCYIGGAVETAKWGTKKVGGTEKGGTFGEGGDTKFKEIFKNNGGECLKKNVYTSST